MSFKCLLILVTFKNKNTKLFLLCQSEAMIEMSVAVRAIYRETESTKIIKKINFHALTLLKLSKKRANFLFFIAK